MPSLRSLLCANRSITQRGEGEGCCSRRRHAEACPQLSGTLSRTVFVVFPYTRCGGLSGAEILSRRVLGITESTPLPGDLEFRAAPTAWGCRARTTRPTGHDTVTLYLYAAKGQCSLSVFVRTTSSAGECRSPMGKPQAVGGECATDNPQQPVTVRGSPRTTSPPL